MDDALSGGKPAKWFFDRFAKKNRVARNALGKAETSAKFSGACTSGWLPSRCHRNALITGDAARLIDPLLGYGVNHAILSGYRAASAIIGKGMDGHEAVSNEYESALNKTVIPELFDGARAKRVFNKLSNHDLDMIMELVKSISARMNLDDFLDSPASYPAEVIGAVAFKPKYALLLRHLHRMI
ncbi:Digeranylgeranylglycerophospholipid reductase [uncultured archaeon]|nr:Digeranylgeranylglycerophospholipid reductase [uncultured archaeon]